MEKTPYKVLVVGDFMLDYYYWGVCDRISPEAPVPIVDVQRESWSLGGAGNVVKNFLALGVQVDVGTVIGEDAGGRKLTETLLAKSVGVQGLLTRPERRTSIKNRLIAGHQQVLRFDKETRQPLDEATADELLSNLVENMADYQAIILSDYAKGVLTPELTQALIESARKYDLKVYVDPKGDDFSKYRGAYLMTPNRKEVAQATRTPAQTQEELSHACRLLKTELDLIYMVVTLSEAGIGIFEEELTIVPTAVKDVFDVTGAGDTALAALVYALLEGQDMVSAANFANAAAAVVIGKLGSETATLTEISHYLSHS